MDEMPAPPAETQETHAGEGSTRRIKHPARGGEAGALRTDASADHPARRPRRALTWLLASVAVAALLLALLSLTINALLVQKLLAAQQEGREVMDASIAALDDFSLGDLTFNYVFSDTIVYSGTVPISQTIVFPFEGNVPFQGSIPFQGVVPVVINVPVIGAQTFRVPVNTSVYVDTAVDVSTTLTVPVQMTFPFAVEMPVRMPIDIVLSLDEQPQLAASLSLMRDILIDLRSRLFE